MLAIGVLVYTEAGRYEKVVVDIIARAPVGTDGIVEFDLEVVAVVDTNPTLDEVFF